MPFLSSNKKVLEEALTSQKIHFYTWKRPDKERMVVAIQNRNDLVSLCKFIKTLNQNHNVYTLITLGSAPKFWDFTDAKAQFEDTFLERNNLNVDVIAHLIGPEFELIERIGPDDSDILAFGPNVQSRSFLQKAEQEFKLLPQAIPNKPRQSMVHATANDAFCSSPLPSVSAMTLALEVVRADGEIELLDLKQEPNFLSLRSGHLLFYGVVIKQYVQCSPLSYKMQMEEKFYSYQQFLQEVENGLYTRDKAQRMMVTYIPGVDDHNVDTRLNVNIRSLTPVDIATEDKGEPLKPLPLFTLPHSEMKSGESQVSVASWSQQVFDDTPYPPGTDNFGLILRCEDQSEKLINALVYIFKKTNEYKSKHDFPLAIRFQAQRHADSFAYASLSTTYHTDEELLFRISFYSIRKHKVWEEYKREVIDRLTLIDYCSVLDLSLNLPADTKIFELYGDRYFIAKASYNRFNEDRNLDPELNPFISQEIRELLPKETVEEVDDFDDGYEVDTESLVLPPLGKKLEQDDLDDFKLDDEDEPSEVDTQRFAVSILALPSLSILAKNLSPINEGSELLSAGVLSPSSTPGLGNTPRQASSQPAAEDDGVELDFPTIHSDNEDSDYDSEDDIPRLYCHY